MGGQHATAELTGLIDEWSPDAALVIDSEGLIVFASSSVRRLAGWDPCDLVGRSSLELVHIDDLEYTIGSLFEANANPGDHGAVELRLLCRDGHWMLTEVLALNPPDDPVGRMVIVIRDISARAGLPERRRRLEQSVLHVAAECAGSSADGLDAVLSKVLAMLGTTLEADEVVLTSINPDRDAVVAWGWSSDSDVAWDPGFPLDVESLMEAAGQVLNPARLRVALGPAIRACVEQPILDAAGLSGMLTVVWRTVDARRYWDEGNAKLLEAVARILVLTANRTQRERALAHQALHDPLTGLANRANLIAALDHELIRRAGREATGLTLIFCDLNGFKAVNDTYGHGPGDALLRGVGDVLSRAVRRGDLVCRSGGDEFVVLCPELTERAEANEVVRRITAAFEHPFVIGPDLCVPVSLAMGVAVVDSTAASQHTAEALLHLADAAMYSAKRSGSNEVRFVDPAELARTATRD